MLLFWHGPYGFRTMESPVRKIKKHFAENTFLSFVLSLMLVFQSMLSANDQTEPVSTITLPIQVDLKVLENYLNNAIPVYLADIDEKNRVCVQPKYFKTKGIPKCRMRGHKISCKTGWIKIRFLPKIKCDIEGWIKRDGRITVSGRGETLRFAFPIKSQVTARSHIQETANASAILYVDAIPHINKDWSISLDLAHDFTWSAKPTITLLNFVKINIQNKVEPKIKLKLDKFVKKVPQLLADLNIKERISTAWKDVQEPFKLDVDSETYLLFKPHAVSCSGFSIVDNCIKTTISAKGKTVILVGDPSEDCRKTELCDIGSILHQEGKFMIHLPVSITYRELLDILSKRFREGYSIDMLKNVLPGILKVSDPKIEKSSTGKIRISAHINYDNRSPWLRTIDLFNWFDVDGEITFIAAPRIDKQSRSLVLDHLLYDSTTSSDLFDLLVNAAQMEPLTSYFASLMKFDFGEKVDESIIEANEALQNFSKKDMNLSARLEMASIEDMMIEEKEITINTKLSGVVNAKIEVLN